MLRSPPHPPLTVSLSPLTTLVQSECGGASASPVRLSGANQLHCVVDLGAAGDHFSLRVVAVQQFGDPYLTDVLAAVAWTAGPRMPDTALVPDHIQHLPDLGAVGLPDADHERLVPLLQHLAAHQDVVAEPALARGCDARQCEGECECAHQRQCGEDRKSTR